MYMNVDMDMRFNRFNNSYEVENTTEVISVELDNNLLNDTTELEIRMYLSYI